jgi:hypothetical protein
MYPHQNFFHTVPLIMLKSAGGKKTFTEKIQQTGPGFYVHIAVNSKSERKVGSLPLLGHDPATFGRPARLSDHSARSHPNQ